MASVRRALPADSARIARLHQEIISWGLLPKLGEPVVTAFYRAVTSSAVAFCFVGEEAGQLEGFAAGVADWPRFLREVIRSTWWPLLRGMPALLIRGRWSQAHA